MKTIIGIDLGTTTTEASVWKDGKPVMVLNFLNREVTPSVVGLDEEGNWIVGEKARSQLLLMPDHTAAEVKRLIGTGETVTLAGREFTPAELSSRILDHVRTYASRFLSEEITRAVISVPAYFNDIQRRETLLAGKMAGLEVERILNEPTAAALSYGLDHMEEESHILVYDLGGGTFDVSVLEMFEGILEVKASSGDNRLGGKDFDEKLVARLLEDFRLQNGIDLSGDRYAMVQLKNEAEKCKMALSSGEEYRLILPALAKKGGEPVGLDRTFTREEFEALTADLVRRTHAPIDSVLDDAGLRPSDLDRIILVGGSTRMPMIAKDIEEYLHLAPSAAVDPDFAVAQGTAVQAAIIEGKITPEEGILMTDVNPYTLGVRTFDGITYNNMSVVIPRNATIPATRAEEYSTSSDYQTEAKIEVYQGESEIATSNRFLGEFTVSGIPPARSGREKIRVEFSYDLNGMLKVSAFVVSSGQSASIQINMMDEKTGGEKKEARQDVSGWKQSPLAAKYRALIRKVERKLKTLEREKSDLAEPASEVLYILERAILQRNNEAAAEAAAHLEKLLVLLTMA